MRQTLILQMFSSKTDCDTTNQSIDQSILLSVGVFLHFCFCLFAQNVLGQLVSQKCATPPAEAMWPGWLLPAQTCPSLPPPFPPPP